MNSPRNGEASLFEMIKKDWYILLLILATLIFGLIVYPDLPEQVPRHWNIHGEVDGWMDKSFAVWFFPVLNLGLYALFLVLPQLDPRRENYRRFSRAYRIIRILILLFMLLIYLVTLLVALGYPLQVDTFVRFAVSLLFLLLGNYMGKIKHNYFLGIRTPWTLANEEVWRITHRFAAPLWVGAGALGMALSFFRSPWSAYVFFGAIILVALAPAVYSYLLYRKITGH